MKCDKNIWYFDFFLYFYVFEQQFKEEKIRKKHFLNDFRPWTPWGYKFSIIKFTFFCSVDLSFQDIEIKVGK